MKTAPRRSIVRVQQPMRQNRPEKSDARLAEKSVTEHQAVYPPE